MCLNFSNLTCCWHTNLFQTHSRSSSCKPLLSISSRKPQKLVIFNFLKITMSLYLSFFCFIHPKTQHLFASESLKVFHIQFKTPIDKKRRKLLAKFEISVKALPKRKSLDLSYISSYFTGAFTALFCHCRNTKMRNYGKWERFLRFSSVVSGFKSAITVLFNKQ
jgi:hypothetical protein